MKTKQLHNGPRTDKGYKKAKNVKVQRYRYIEKIKHVHPQHRLNTYSKLRLKPCLVKNMTF